MAWPKIGTVRAGTKNGETYIKLNDGVEIFMDGKKVQLNKSRTLIVQDPRKNLEAMIKNGKVQDEEKAAAQLEKLNSYKWLRAEIVAAPDKTK